MLRCWPLKLLIYPASLRVDHLHMLTAIAISFTTCISTECLTLFVKAKCEFSTLISLQYTTQSRILTAFPEALLQVSGLLKFRWSLFLPCVPYPQIAFKHLKSEGTVECGFGSETCGDRWTCKVLPIDCLFLSRGQNLNVLI